MPLTPDWGKSSFCESGGCLEATFRASTYSQSNGHCLEAAWRKSSHSNANGCTEAALRDGAVLVRDSKNPDGPVLVLTPRQWSAFIGPLGSPKHRVLRVRGMVPE